MSKRIFILIVATGTLVILSIIGLIVYAFSKPSITISKGDENITVIFDGDYYTTPVTIRNLSYGDHDIVTHVSDYKDFVKTVSLKPFQKLKYELDLVKLSGPEATDKEEALWSEFFEKQGAELKKDLDKRYQANPLTNYLPYFGKDFWFDYYVENDEVVYFVKAANYTNALKEVNAWIKTKGLDPNEIYIKQE